MDYYRQLGITEEQFKTFKYPNGFNKGDVMVLTSAKNAELGDVIVFIAANGRPIIHRVVNVDPLETKGDRNGGQIRSADIDEFNIKEESLVGKASLRIPWIGYVKIAFTSLLSLIGVQIS